MATTLEELDRLLAQRQQELQSSPGGAPATNAPASGATQLPSLIMENDQLSIGTGNEPELEIPEMAGVARKGPQQPSLEELDQQLAQRQLEMERGQNERSASDRAANFQGTLGAIQGPVADILRTTNTNIANLLGYPVELVNELLGHAGLNFLKNPGDAQHAVREAFRRFGADVKEKDAETFFERVGDEVLPALLGAYGLIGLSGRGLASGNAVLQGLDDFALRHPTATITTSLAAAPGTVKGGDIGADALGAAGERVGRTFGDPETGRKVGEMTGRTVGAVVGGAATGTLGAFRVRPEIPQHRQGILDSAADPEVTTGFAANQIQRERMAVDTAIEQTLARFRGPHTLTPAETSRTARDSLDNIYDQARAVEANLWARVPRDVEVDMGPLEAAAMRQLHFADTIAEQVPPHVERILQLADAVRNGTRARITTGELQQLRQSMLTAHREAGGSTVTNTPPRRTTQRILSELDDALVQAVEDALGPDAVTWQQARAFTRYVKDRFTRGEIGRVLQQDYQSQDRVHPDDMMAELLKRSRGLQDLQRAADTHPHGMAVPPAAGLQGRRQLLDDTAEAIYAQMLHAIDDTIDNVGTGQLANAPADTRMVAGATTGRKWIRQHEPHLRAMANIAAEMRQTRTALEAQIARRQEIDRSALAQFVQGDADNAIRAVLGAPDPALRARQLRNEFARDRTPLRAGRPQPEAEAGFQRGLLAELLRRGGKSMTNLHDFLTTTRNEKLLRAAFDGKDVERIYNITRTAALAEKGVESASRGRTRKALTWIAYVAGLHAGRTLAIITSQGSAGQLSMPAKASRAFQQAVTDAFAREAPSTLLVEAMLNPRIERLLLSRIPENFNTAKNTLRQQKQLVKLLETSRYSTDQLLKDLSGRDKKDGAR